jgi:hypothetical protein
MFPIPGQRDSLRRSGAVEFQPVIHTAFLHPIEAEIHGTDLAVTIGHTRWPPAAQHGSRGVARHGCAGRRLQPRLLSVVITESAWAPYPPVPFLGSSE